MDSLQIEFLVAFLDFTLSASHYTNFHDLASTTLALNVFDCIRSNVIFEASMTTTKRSTHTDIISRQLQLEYKVCDTHK